MSANEYYRNFTYLSRYYPEIAVNPTEMLHHFRLSSRKKWRSMATMTPCTTYQEFHEILLQVEDYENMPSDSGEEEEKDNSQKKNDNKDKDWALAVRAMPSLRKSDWSRVIGVTDTKTKVGERVLVGPEIVDETIQNIQITERVGEVTYRLELPPELSKVHDVFPVSMLRHYISDPSHMIPPQPLEINPYLTYDEEPVTILDWKDKVLRNKTMRLVKVLWRNHSVKESTWETEDHMRDMYPRLFYGY
ncbi:uncharacterized protein [Malus domestica]|uniref:uncharacterized protein n=1 Tax=Malus domestica TaxID=3750 RepID=UPI0039760110